MTEYIQKPAPKRLLHVEDDHMAQEVVRRYFESKGYVVDTAPDVFQAMLRLMYIRYDAIILDYVLPLLQPEEYAHSLRKARVPICYYTAASEVVGSMEANGIPVVPKAGIMPERGGLHNLLDKLEELMARPLPLDYDKTSKLKLSDIFEAREKAGAEAEGKAAEDALDGPRAQAAIAGEFPDTDSTTLKKIRPQESPSDTSERPAVKSPDIT